MFDTTIKLDGRKLLTEVETANILHIEVATLRRWRWAGNPPRFLKIGAAVRYDPAELQEFIECSRRSSTSDVGAGDT
jgi:hypothetical protein